jgi:AcrR family transcriptional regulator
MARPLASRQPINTGLHEGRKPPQRERLLAGMVAAANHYGYAGASVSEVIGQARVSRPTFYEHFDDRDECFVACVEDVHTRLLGETRRAVEASPPERALHAAIEALIAFAAAEPVRTRFLTREALSGPPAALEARDSAISETARMVERALALAPAETPIPDLPPSLAIGATHRLLASRLRRGEHALNGVLEELLGWIHGYERPVAEHRWRAYASIAGRAIGPSGRAPTPSAPTRPALDRTRLPEETLAEWHRRRIMLATVQVVAERGYTAATIEDITRLARVDGSAFYSVFADKQDAFDAIYDHGLQHTTATVASAYFTGESWPECTWEALRAASESARRNPVATHIGFVEAHAVGPSAAQRVEDSRFAFTVFLHEGLRWSQRLERPAPALALEAVLATVFEIVYHEARGPQPLKDTSLLARLAHVCLTPFLGPEQADRFIGQRLGHVMSRGGRTSKSSRRGSADREPVL